MRAPHGSHRATAALVALLVAVSCTAPPTPPAVSVSPSAEGGIGAPAEVVDPDAQLVTNAGIFGEPRVIDPQHADLPAELDVALSVFEGLLVLDPATLRPAPGAAEALPSVSVDGKTFTYTLRPGLTYSDGAPLTASDFAYAYARSCDARTRTRTNAILFVIAGCERLAAMDPGTATDADFEAARAALGVKALDERRIEFTTVEAAPYFAAITTLVQGLPARRADVERGDTWTQPGTYIGNGPFKLVSWDRGQSMVFERNERYRAPVKLKSWKLVMIQDKTVEFAGYQNDEIHFIEVTTEQMRAVSADPALRAQLKMVPTGCSHFYAFNTTRPPFDDQKVRLAFAKSIDRADFVQKVLGGIGRPADRGLIPADHPGYDDGDSAQAFDAAAAKRLLAESAYSGSLPSVTFTTFATAVNQIHAQWVRAQWRANLGVDVTIETIESRVYSQVIQTPDTAPQIFVIGWCSDVPDPHNFHATIWGTGGAIAARTGFSDPEIDAALLRATEARDPAAAADQYMAAGRLLSRAAPGVWLYYSQRAALVKPWVRGLTPPAHRYTALAKHEIYLIKRGAGATGSAAATSTAAPAVAPTAAAACPTGYVFAGAPNYEFPLGYSIQLRPGWRPSEIQSHSEPAAGGDPEHLATQAFTTRSHQDELEVGRGPAAAYTAWVRIYRNSARKSTRQFAEEESREFGLKIVSLLDFNLRALGCNTGGRPATRVTLEWPVGGSSTATYVEDDKGRVWAIGFSLAMSKADIPPGATEEDLRWMVGTFSAPWLRD